MSRKRSSTVKPEITRTEQNIQTMMREIVMERLIMEGSLEGVAFELCFEKKVGRIGLAEGKEGHLRERQ